MIKSPTVLIVEDEEVLMRALADGFKAKGYQVLGAYDGEKGLEISLKSLPDMILLDLTMPVMDGVTMLKKMREYPNGRQLKVIVLTNLNVPAKASETAGLGIIDYIVKSDWKLKDIIDRVSTELSLQDANLK
jgi:DNA-binding response OmpR family regulator